MFFFFIILRWGFIIACILAVISILFFGSLYAITGLQFIIQPFVSPFVLAFRSFYLEPKEDDDTSDDDLYHL